MALQLLLDYLTGQLALVNVGSTTPPPADPGMDWGMLLLLRNNA